MSTLNISGKVSSKNQFALVFVDEFEALLPNRNEEKPSRELEKFLEQIGVMPNLSALRTGVVPVLGSGAEPTSEISAGLSSPKSEDRDSSIHFIGFEELLRMMF